MCLIPLRSKALKEVWDIVPTGQCESAHLCLRLGQSKGGVAPMCLRQLIIKTFRDGRDIVPMGQWELVHICLRLGQS